MNSNKVLVTGFDRFGYLKLPNASSEIALPAIKEKYGDLVETLILPVARDIAGEQLIEAIKDIDPATIAMFGISTGWKVRLERRAKNNRFNMFFPDNEGVRKIGRIDSQGPMSFDATLPLDDIYARLQEAEVPTKLSNDAGSFVCNEVMYRALQHTESIRERRIIPTGFIHLGNGLSEQLTEQASLLVVDELIKSANPSP